MTPLDLVVLADCSGSMSCDDIPGPAGAGFLARLDAIKSALLRLAGTPHRLALMAFTTDASVVFPRTGGMSTIDDPAEFHEAVGSLVPRSPGTDVGQALYLAADLLHRQGLPGHDRLIVLASDGIAWAPKGAETTGEVLDAAADPPSLMAELRRSLGVRLEPVVVGDETTFRSWWIRQQRDGEPPSVLMPDHRLMTELARIGGGELFRAAGAEALDGYFEELSRRGS